MTVGIFPPGVKIYLDSVVYHITGWLFLSNKKQLEWSNEIPPSPRSLSRATRGEIRVYSDLSELCPDSSGSWGNLGGWTDFIILVTQFVAQAYYDWIVRFKNASNLCPT